MFNYIDYLPDYLRDFDEFQKLGIAKDPESNLGWESVKLTIDNMFVESATNIGIKRWESILKISPKGTDSLEDRKFRVLARLNERVPYTETVIREKLAFLCGADGYSLVVDNKSFTMTVRVALARKSQYNDIEVFLRRAIPANISLDISLLYNQHNNLSQFTHGTLSKYTHNQMKDEVIS